ncbi:MAG: hypothetical protein MI975_14395 [Cytophagales bacterium]|nr:hypothetical protein [Cytophagales bacterium]
MKTYDERIDMRSVFKYDFGAMVSPSIMRRPHEIAYMILHGKGAVTS